MVELSLTIHTGILGGKVVGGYRLRQVKHFREKEIWSQREDRTDGNRSTSVREGVRVETFKVTFVEICVAMEGKGVHE